MRGTGKEAQPGVCAHSSREISGAAHRTSAQALGIRVVVTEESYTSQASFLDLDVLPTFDPIQGAEQEEKPRFSGSRDGRWYRVRGRAPMHADVNGSFNIGRKVFPTAFGKGDSGHRRQGGIWLAVSTRELWQMCQNFWILYGQGEITLYRDGESLVYRAGERFNDDFLL